MSHPTFQPTASFCPSLHLFETRQQMYGYFFVLHLSVLTQDKFRLSGCQALSLISHHQRKESNWEELGIELRSSCYASDSSKHSSSIKMSVIYEIFKRNFFCKNGSLIRIFSIASQHGIFRVFYNIGPLFDPFFN